MAELENSSSQQDTPAAQAAQGAYGAGVRAQVFEVIVRQALAGAPWRQICAGPMTVNEIDPEEIEAEVSRRLQLPDSGISRGEIFVKDMTTDWLRAVKFSEAVRISETKKTGLASEVPDTSEYEKFIAFHHFSDSVDTCINEFINKTLNAAEINSSSLKDAIDRVYQRLGHAAPRIVVVETPFYFGTLPLLFHVYKSKTQSTAPNQVLKDLKSFLHPYANKKLWERFEQLLKDTSDCAELGANLSSKVSNRLFNLRSNLSQGLEYEIQSRYKRMLELRLQNRIFRILNRLREANASRIDWKKNDHNLQNHIYEIHHKYFRTYSGIRPHDPLSANTGVSPLGAWEMYSLLLHKAVVNACGQSKELFQSEDAAELDDFLQLLNQGFAYSFMENICFVLKHPKIVLDEQDRLHNGSGPALDFGGEYKRYAWHGTIIPKNAIENSKLFHPLLIDNVRNLELRRVLIEIYGWEKYLRAFGSRVVHEDRFGKLICRGKFQENQNQRTTDEPEMAVEVLNSTPEPDGSFRRYLLRVPPNMTTAKQAVAWTFGLTADEYEPMAES